MRIEPAKDINVVCLDIARYEVREELAKGVRIVRCASFPLEVFLSELVLKLDPG